jgi:hypothetical protein
MLALGFLLHFPVMLVAIQSVAAQVGNNRILRLSLLDLRWMDWNRKNRRTFDCPEGIQGHCKMHTRNDDC